MKYFIAGPEREVGVAEYVKITQEVYIIFDDIISGIRFFKNTFSLQFKEG